MPLSQASLASDLQSLFSSLPATPSDCADGMAQAYYTYASVAMFGASVPTILPALKTAMAATLLAAITNPLAGTSAALANAWASAVGTFWTAIPVTGAQAGATAGCPGAPSMTTPLTTLFSALGNTAAACANGLAAQLHTATSTVTAAVAPPAGTVLPIT